MNEKLNIRMTVKKMGDYWRIYESEREIKSPLGRRLNIPNKKLAKVLAKDFSKSIRSKNPCDNYYLRLANNACDIVPKKREKMIASIADYIFTDTICYRDKKNNGLYCLQIEKWGPIVEWFSKFTSFDIIVTEGIDSIKQPKALHNTLVKWFKTFNNHQISALDAFTSTTGSVILGISILMGRTNILKVPSLSLLEEEFSRKKWKLDYEDVQRNILLRRSIISFANYLYLAGNCSILNREFIKITTF